MCYSSQGHINTSAAKTLQYLYIGDTTAQIQLPSDFVTFAHIELPYLLTLYTY